MVFKRRNKRPWFRLVLEAVYPRGGWNRAAIYMKHRLHRLPDAPHRIARGIFAGVFISFSPLFGLHFTAAALLAWLMRGNIVAAIMATFVGNPITFPFIAAFGVEFGNLLLGRPMEMSPIQIFAAFGQAGAEFWSNVKSLFNDDVAHWDRLARFFSRVYLPYLVGGILPGLIGGTIAYYLSLPVIGAYQKRRQKKLRDRLAKRVAVLEARQGKDGQFMARKADSEIAAKATSRDDAAANKG